MSQNIKVSIGRNLGRYRKQKRFTQQQLAQKVHCDRTLISKMENGNPNVAFSIELLVLLSGELDCTLHDLIPNY